MLIFYWQNYERAALIGCTMHRRLWVGILMVCKIKTSHIQLFEFQWVIITYQKAKKRLGTHYLTTKSINCRTNTSQRYKLSTNICKYFDYSNNPSCTKKFCQLKRIVHWKSWTTLKVVQRVEVSGFSVLS